MRTIFPACPSSIASGTARARPCGARSPPSSPPFPTTTTPPRPPRTRRPRRFRPRCGRTATPPRRRARARTARGDRSASRRPPSTTPWRARSPPSPRTTAPPLRTSTAGVESSTTPSAPSRARTPATVAGPETALPALPARPAPSLTWDQHHVFLQYPPTRRRVAAELPRGLTPAMLAELYRSVEREQRRYMAHLDAVARANPDGGASYLTVGPVRVARAEEVARAREVRRGLARAPRFVSVSRVDGGDVSLVAARLARLEPVHFERLESGSGVEPTPAPVPLPPDAFPRRGDRLADDAAAALEATGEAAGEAGGEYPRPSPRRRPPWRRATAFLWTPRSPLARSRVSPGTRPGDFIARGTCP